ncbi:PaREP1 family protein [Acidianus manzaensis]|uniref:PaREP1 family protein n=1 Tax=Acidianus manzaensis TaxID=282676 RepID=A0A1W6JX52_9CREN|nr:PaREP1 family protein [Acidianus manzaensis]ARM74812.1 hypothetical protein B6F84_01410 [Acidianus manzaensis]
MTLAKSSARIYYEEANELLDKGIITQASKKYYKAAEEAIKILAISEGEQINEWNADILNDIVLRLAMNYGDWIITSWSKAIALLTVDLPIDVVDEYRYDLIRLIELADEKFNSKNILKNQ